MGKVLQNKKLFTYTVSKKLALRLHRNYVKIESKLHRLNYFFWECTSACNLACLHCGSDCMASTEIPDMPAEDFLKVAEKVSKQYNPADVMIVITGGEPLLRKDLPLVGMKLKNLGFPWGLVSNGYMLTNELFRTLRESGLQSATISLDGLRDNHDWLRGRAGSFDRAVKAIEILAAEPGFTYDVVTCVNQRNFSELLQIKELLIDLNVSRWRLFLIDPIGRAAENKELFIDSDQMNSLLQFVVNTRQDGEIVASWGCDGFLAEYETRVRSGFLFCRAGIHVASVLSNGDISACPNINRGFVQGNIYNDDFLNVWNNRFEIFRNRKHFKTGQCLNCSLWKDCLGDGMHLHEPENDNPVVCYYRKLKGIE